MSNTKYPKQYNDQQLGNLRDPFKPEFRYDTRGRLFMPLPGYAKWMLSTEPGSKRIGQGSEGPAGGGDTNPESLQTGYLTATTAIKCGPEGGWVVALQGGDAEYPIQYGNETTGVLNFYIDKLGQVYCSALNILGGTGVANLDDAGALALLDQANLDTDVAEGTAYKRTKALAIDENGMVLLDKTVEGTYGRVLTTAITAGNIVLSQTVQSADFRTVTDIEKALWNSSEGDISKGDTPPVDPNVNDLWIDTSVTPNLLKRWSGTEWILCSVGNLDDLEEGTTYKRTKSAAVSVDGFVLLDETIIGDNYSLVAKTDIQAGHILLSTAVQNSSFRTVTDAEKALWDSSQGDIFQGPIAPPSPDVDDLWIDTSTSPSTFKRWTGSDWDLCGVGSLDDLAEGTVYKRTKSIAISSGGLVLLDELSIGSVFDLVLKTDISAGHILLSMASGDLGDIDDGGGYSKVNTTAIDAGKILLTASVGVSGVLPVANSEAKCTDPLADETADNPQTMSWITDAGLLAVKDAVDLATAEVANKFLDNIEDGTFYGKVLATDLSGGHILLSECSGIIDDIADGTVFGKIKLTDISAGHILLSESIGDLDDIIDGIYAKVKATSIDAGKIIVTGGVGITGVLPVGNSEAKCTDPLADETETNPQSYAWVTGTKPPIDADHTADIVSAMAYEDLVEKEKLGTTIVEGGYIKSGLVIATNIIAGTFTGLQFRTSAGPQRAVLEVAGTYQNQLVFYYDNDLIGRITNFVNKLNVWGAAGAGGGVNIRVGDYSAIEVWDTTPGNPIVEIVHLRPRVNNNYDLGYSTLNWDSVYFNTWKRGTDKVLEYLGGADMTIYRHMIPNLASANLVLGGSTKYFHEINSKSFIIRGSGGEADFSAGKVKLPVGTNLY